MIQCFLPELFSLSLQKYCAIVLMQIKVLITLFQKTVLFTGTYATLHEVLRIKESKKQKYNKVL